MTSPIGFHVVIADMINTILSNFLCETNELFLEVLWYLMKFQWPFWLPLCGQWNLIQKILNNQQNFKFMMSNFAVSTVVCSFADYADGLAIEGLWYGFFTVMFNSLLPSDGHHHGICHQRTWSTLVTVTVHCRMLPSHYLNQCWLIISESHWQHLMAITWEIQQLIIKELASKLLI